MHLSNFKKKVLHLLSKRHFFYKNNQIQKKPDRVSYAQFSFEALGTKWYIIFDESIEQLLISQVTKIVQDFENNYSRFKPNSIVGKYNAGKKISTSAEFTQMLKFAKELEKHSCGYFNRFSGKVLGNLGYGKKEQGLDFGAFGKGWLLDKISSYLKQQNYKYFLINAGGDVLATKKSDGSHWTVGLEHPTKSNFAIGTLQLKNQALAASSPFKRNWKNDNKNYNHLINGKTGKPIQKNRAVFTLSKNAKTADGLATALCVMPIQTAKKISHTFSTEFLIIQNNKITQSKKFTATLF